MDDGYRDLCGRCFNAQVAAGAGLDDFKHTEFQPITLPDYVGEDHEFHFRLRLFGPLVALDAFELRDEDPGGYRFQVIGKPDEDPFLIFCRMIDKIRRALALQHIVGSDHALEIADHRTVRGRIEWDANQGSQLPLLVIDGREIRWAEFGRMLMSYEGWQFKLMIVDKSEEV